MSWKYDTGPAVTNSPLIEIIEEPRNAASLMSETSSERNDPGSGSSDKDNDGSDQSDSSYE